MSLLGSYFSPAVVVEFPYISRAFTISVAGVVRITPTEAGVDVGL